MIMIIYSQKSLPPNISAGSVVSDFLRYINPCDVILSKLKDCLVLIMETKILLNTEKILKHCDLNLKLEEYDLI